MMEKTLIDNSTGWILGPLIKNSLIMNKRLQIQEILPYKHISKYIPTVEPI